MSKLVIVESPTKAKTIAKFLGKNFIVKSSFGHVRDLPKTKMGIDIDHGFEPKYVVSRDKSKTVKELKEAAKKADEVLFATDSDREGEAISWHLAHILGIAPEETKRITFHEITKSAIEHALKNPRMLDLKLVDAQQARRVLDRLVGYELSPFLWHKVAKGLSAGRVQSVAVRLMVEREREIQAFNKEEYWSVEGMFAKKDDRNFPARLTALNGKAIGKMGLKNSEDSRAIVEEAKNQKYAVAEIAVKDVTRSPAPPFTTSTLQQEAARKLGIAGEGLQDFDFRFLDVFFRGYCPVASRALQDYLNRGDFSWLQFAQKLDDRAHAHITSCCIT